MNDSLRTDVFVRYNPETIACACIYLAAGALEIPLPNRPHWFLLFGATEEDIKEICMKILKLYTRKKANLEHLDDEVERRKVALQEAKAKAKGLLPDGTPALDTPAGFSPSSKTDSPKDGKFEKPSPLSAQAMKNARRKLDEEEKRARSGSPFNGVQKGRNSRSRSYSRSRSRSHSPKRRRTRSRSASNSSRSHSHSRSRSDSPPQRFKRSSPYIGRSKVREYDDMRDYKYLAHKHRRSRSRSYSKSLSRSRSRSRDRLDFSRKHKESRGHHGERRHERSRSYERPPKHHNSSHSGHSRHRR
ncbi:cyclin-L1 isoform X2 [Callorhinchus milii]|uniref:Cyclin L2 n=2 Tax=Callorhinchus milii TaxID=7868 RepID=V9KFD9_CALMI|nr:cyclin-L1 isoform X2 [Callorhinchus milii]